MFCLESRICVSLAAANSIELVALIDQVRGLDAVVEIRFDALDPLELPVGDATVLRRLVEIIGARIPSERVLATFRPKSEGGFRELSSLDRKWFHDHLKFGAIHDFEEDVFVRCAPGLSIISKHDFEGVPADLYEIYDRLRATGAEIVKIAYQTEDATDTIPAFRLLEKAKRDNVQLIPIAMGESGKLTRIIGPARGAMMSYASSGNSGETAPGQISAKDLAEVYRIGILSGQTEIYGILGSNTSVSMSPYMHNAAFAHQGFDKVFAPIQTKDLSAFMKRMVRRETREIDLNFRGFAVTIPHKEAIIAHLDELHETAAKIGAVNTVRIDDGKLVGFNTDAPGFIEPLLNSYGDLKNARVAIIGAGGAARACVYALVNRGADVTVFARDAAKAELLATEFGAKFAKLGGSSFGDFDILVNSTPLGMTGKGDGQSPATADQLAGLHLVYDLVYIPFQTPLMDEADKAEVPKIGGFAMLLAQALEQQRIWTGVEPPAAIMARAALERLK